MEMKNTTAKRWVTAQRDKVVDGSAVEIDVYVRSLSPPLGARQQQERVLRQLQNLENEGLIDTYRVNLWGGGVCLCDICSGTGVGESMVDTIEEFEAWAADQGDVTLPFERQRVDSTVLDRASQDLVVPSLCLRVTVDSETASVFPCTVAGESTSVSDFIDLLTEIDAVETDTPRTQDQVVQI
jgi:hypothetical protein